MSVRSEKPPYRLAFPAGRCGSVCFGRQSDDTEPAWIFWESAMTVRQQAAFGTLFRMIVNSANLQLANRRKFKKIDGELFAFKSVPHQMRIFCFRRKDCWYLTSGFAGKKEDELPSGEVKRALAIMEDCMAELDRFEADAA